MKNTSKAITVGALLGALFLGGCAADTSAEPAAKETSTATGTPSPSMTASPSAPAAEELTLPASRGLESTPVVVDPSLEALPGVADSVQAAMANFLQASRSFPDLQKGSRPMTATDGDLLAPVMQPLMSEKAWYDSVQHIQNGQVPSWYPAGNLVSLLSTKDDAVAKRFIADDNGYSFVHASKTPLTISVADTGYPGTYIVVKGMSYRTFFTNTLGEVVALQMEMEYTFTPGPDGNWDMWKWSNIPQHSIAKTQAQVDSMADF